MLYAKVVFGLAIEGPFDYIVPEEFYGKIKIGMRVWVNFSGSRRVGYVVGLSRSSGIKRLKALSTVIDQKPLLDAKMLLLSRRIADYYCCSWGEIIESALPQKLRLGKVVKLEEKPEQKASPKDDQILLLFDPDRRGRWQAYFNNIDATLKNGRQILMLFPDISSAVGAKEKITGLTGIEPCVIWRNQPDELDIWLKIKNGRFRIIIGTRSAVFAPAGNLGLIIIDEEQNQTYKQDQVPHYHAREVSFMRSSIDEAKLILGSSSPSLEVYYPAKVGIKVSADLSFPANATGRRKIVYSFIPSAKKAPEVNIVDTSFGYRQAQSDRSILSVCLRDAIALTVASGGKALLFINRTGFATFASCNNCGFILKCQRCNSNLVYHFQEKVLRCHHCNYKISPPEVCPSCNAGYIRYTGLGTEKIESEIARVFPQFKIKRIDDKTVINTEDSQILIATGSVLEKPDFEFSVVGVLAIDNSLNRIDIRAAEKTYAILSGLSVLASWRLIIQTSLSENYCFRSLKQQNPSLFYDEELKTRRQLKFPPFSHIALIKLRSHKESKVRESIEALFNKLRKEKPKGIKFFSFTPAQLAKLRGNYCWQIMAQATSAVKLSRGLKNHLKDFKHSGIILTVDVDPQ